MTDEAPAQFWTTRGEFGCLSNFSKHSVIYHGMEFATTEHLYQALKMTNGEDFQKVRKAESPKESKLIAHSLPCVSNWDAIKYETMKQVLRLKVEQHKEVRLALEKTGNREIQEASPKDYIWGTGKDGSGQNLLGKAWMEIRKEVLT